MVECISIGGAPLLHFQTGVGHKKEQGGEWGASGYKLLSNVSIISHLTGLILLSRGPARERGAFNCVQQKSD